MHEVMRDHMLRNLEKGIRLDGRSLDEYRQITIETGVSATAEGSARVSIGNTTVIAGVKLGLEKPYPDTPDQGNLMINAELLPLSSPLFESGPPSATSIELSRVIDRGIRESHMINQEKLCVKSGEQVWSVMVDICPINHAGNLLDAASIAALAALKSTVFPAVDKNGKVDYKTKTKNKLPLEKLAVSVTVHKIGDHFVMDPSTLEESHSDARLTVCSMDDGMLCALQKGGRQPLTVEAVEKMIDMAVAQAKVSRKAL